MQKREAINPFLPLMLAMLFVFAGVAAAGPKISCPEPVYDFGEKSNTETVPHDFIIKNEGDAELIISDVKTSCGCTVASLDKKNLAPGEETKISATLKLSGEGPRTKEITVNSNDPETPQYILKFTGSAIAAVKYEPNTLDFGQVLDDSPKELKLKMYAALDDFTFNITGVNLNQDFLEARYETLEAGKSYEITVTNSKPFPAGRIAAMLNITTDNETAKEFRVYVTGNVLGDYWVQPDVLRLRYDPAPGKVMNGFLRVSPGKVKQFNIVDVVKPVDTIDVQYEKQGEAYLVRLQNMPVDESLDGQKLVLKTDVTGHEEIVVPIMIMRPQTPVAPAPGAVIQPGAPVPAPGAVVQPGAPAAQTPGGIGVVKPAEAPAGQ